VRDPVPEGRDGCRTPRQWTSGPGAGFTDAADTWLPLGDAGARNVEDQRADPGSVLNLVRDLIAVRRDRDDLRSGAYATLPAPDGEWAWRRGDGTAVVLNLSDAPVAVDGLTGSVVVATDRAREGERVDGALALAPWSGAVLDVG
jgi:alpha-glucosidase